MEPGESVAILGANGAGKTTTLRCVVGLTHPSQGRIVFAGKDIGTLPTHEIASLGIALVPEGRRLFARHTVRENLELGAYPQLRMGRRKEFQKSLMAVLDIFPLIAERLDQPAGQLSGGEQQMVAVARALVSRPQLLLLDEPSLGLSPKLVHSMFEVFSRLNKEGLTILMAEQMTKAAVKSCDRAIVLQRGRIIMSGASRDLATDPRIVDAYLGTSVIFGG